MAAGDDADSRRIILSRRARFVTAALAGIAGCGPAHPAEVPVEVAVADAGAPVAPVAPVAPRTADVEPDADGDGIPDEVDACPMQPGSANPDPKKHGCPCLSVMVCLSIVIMQNKVEFPTNGAKPMPASAAILDATAATLTNNPQIDLDVEGHTDSTEPSQLALQRAEAVKKELVRRGIDPARLTTTSAGATKPIADNATLDGRAKNRRVELHVR